MMSQFISNPGGNGTSRKKGISEDLEERRSEEVGSLSSEGAIKPRAVGRYSDPSE